jgi:membrane-bound ClpP family serine protease
MNIHVRLAFVLTAIAAVTAAFFSASAEAAVAAPSAPGARPSAAAPAPATATPAPTRPPAAAPAPATGTPAALAYVLPISGIIESHALVEALEKGLDEAKKKKAGLIILRMNTPGGRVYVADKIIKGLEKVDWAPVVSYVSGEDRRALSAGAYICLATQKIFMAPGSTLGAATPYTRKGGTGSAQVDEKFASAFRARFRSLAQTHGYPAALAEAMVDGTTSVVQVFVDGKPMLVTDDEAKQLQDEHKSDGKFKRGKVVNKPGKLITLTSDEALEFKVCTAVAKDEKELLEKMGLAHYQVGEAKWITAWVEKTTKERKKRIDDLLLSYRTNIQQAVAFDRQRTATILGSPQWKGATDGAMACLKACARAILELERLAKDERYDLFLDESGIKDLKSELDGAYRRLGALRNL